MPDEKPTWLKLAECEIGVKRFPDGQRNPRIEEYHCATSIKGYDDKAAWCSSFLNLVFDNDGIEGTGSALAKSWLNWGDSIPQPTLGCVVVLERVVKNGWQGHVGLFLEQKGDRLYLLGGNQLDEVRVHNYPLTSILAYRWPSS